jgi:hypothetical protein
MNTTRTNTIRGLVAALALIPATLTIGCKSVTAPQQQAAAPAPAPEREPVRDTQVAGQALLRAGQNGDLGNSMAAIYRNIDEWANYMPVAYVRVQGSGPETSFTIGDLVPGTYYLDVWKDVDNSGTWSIGDFVGWFGNGALGAPALTPFMVRDGQTKYVGDLPMYLITGAAQAMKVSDTDR